MMSYYQQQKLNELNYWHNNAICQINMHYSSTPFYINKANDWFMSRESIERQYHYAMLDVLYSESSLQSRGIIREEERI